MKMDSKEIGVDEANELAELKETTSPPPDQVKTYELYTRPITKIIWTLFKFADEIYSIANYYLLVL
jgi:hypothetical protein